MGTEEQEKHLRDSLDVSVRSGFGSNGDVIEAFLDQVQDELDLWDDEDALAPWRREAGQALRTQADREAVWIEPSINDSIDRAFAELSAEGVIALQDAGYTTSDGWSDVADERHDDPTAWGATFFHRQDVERAVDGSGLLLAFGAFVRGEQHEIESLRVAKRVRAVLAKHGVETSWDGSIKTRVRISPFEWRKRRQPS